MVLHDKIINDQLSETYEYVNDKTEFTQIVDEIMDLATELNSQDKVIPKVKFKFLTKYKR